MRLSTVIVNYNTRDHIARALASLVENSGDLSHEIFLVDNASRDGSADMVRERFPTVRLLASETNLWFSGGNNLGMRAAQGEMVYILNPDTVIPPGALQTMIAYLDAHPEAGAVTCRMVFPDGRYQRTCSKLAGFLDLLFDYTLLGPLLKPWRDRRRREMWYEGWDRATNHVVEVAPGSNLMVRRAVLDQSGLFDEALKLYFTEDDLCRRILGTGCEIHFVAGATIQHEEHASINKVQRIATHIYFNDLITYMRKYHGRPAAALLAVLVFPTRAAMYLKQSLRG
ncbi:MAG: glycosyltransferase family 2 protein [Chloroflexi bacterium]|nr:glycosyltransferase family 2 protein [Chloroflexota bacterium]